MAEATLHVDIISPERPLFSGEAVDIVAPAYDGEIGVLQRHASMVCELGIGEVRIHAKDGAGTRTEYYAIHNGFLQTANNRIIIITEEAKAPDDVNEAKVQEELAAVKAKLTGRMPPAERERLKSRQTWLLTLARVARHSRKGMAHTAGLERSGLTLTMDKADMAKRNASK